MCAITGAHEDLLCSSEYYLFHCIFSFLYFFSDIQSSLTCATWLFFFSIYLWFFNFSYLSAFFSARKFIGIKILVGHLFKGKAKKKYFCCPAFWMLWCWRPWEQRWFPLLLLAIHGNMLKITLPQLEKNVLFLLTVSDFSPLLVFWVHCTRGVNGECFSLHVVQFDVVLAIPGTVFGTRPSATKHECKSYLWTKVRAVLFPPYVYTGFPWCVNTFFPLTLFIRIFFTTVFGLWNICGWF